MTLTHTITCLCFCLMTYPRHIWSQTFQIVLMDSTDHHRQGEEFGMFQSLDKYEYSIKSVRIGDNFQQIQYILYLLGENFESTWRVETSRWIKIHITIKMFFFSMPFHFDIFMNFKMGIWNILSFKQVLGYS